MPCSASFLLPLLLGLGLAPLVVGPEPFRSLDILALPLLGAAGQQDHEPAFVLAEVHAVARPEGKPPFRDAFAYGLHVSEVARLDAGERGSDLQRRLRIEPVEPIGEGNLPLLGLVLNNVQLYYHGNI